MATEGQEFNLIEAASWDEQKRRTILLMKATQEKPLEEALRLAEEAERFIQSGQRQHT